MLHGVIYVYLLRGKLFNYQFLIIWTTYYGVVSLTNDLYVNLIVFICLESHWHHHISLLYGTIILNSYTWFFFVTLINPIFLWTKELKATLEINYPIGLIYQRTNHTMLLKINCRHNQQWSLPRKVGRTNKLKESKMSCYWLNFENSKT
jgi:hypothetical protein